MYNAIIGVIKKIETFGAFMELSGTRFQGLCHISQIAKDRIENPAEVVSIGDDVYVKVIKIEESGNGDGKSRISLSMKYCSQFSTFDLIVQSLNISNH